MNNILLEDFGILVFILYVHINIYKVSFWIGVYEMIVWKCFNCGIERG